MPQPNLGPPEVQIGGYIPYVDFPCERFVGESIGWVIFLSTSGPLICSYIPWLCCPIPFEFNNTFAVSADIDCDDIGARYGATLFWTMQAISIWGLILALVNIVRCGVLTTLDSAQEAAENEATQQNKMLLDITNKTLDSLIQVTSGIIDDEIISEKNKEKQEAEDSFLDALSLKNASKARANRVRRQSGFLRIEIPTLNPLFRGSDEKSDGCERDEIMHVDGECHQILSQGPCEETDIVLMDPQTKKGYCGPRLCSPDRVFVFGDQKCHDPFENNICPPGRQLFTSSLGTPVCGCPYGTYEEDEDLDEDVCQPVLGKLESCAPGHVFWFTSFRREPDCVPDPCKGLNAKKGKNELAYAPSNFDGKCYQLGEELPQCPEDTFYTLSYASLTGICASLEDAGYTVLDEETLESFSKQFGPRLPRNGLSSSSFHFSRKRTSKSPDVGSSSDLPFFRPRSNNVLTMKMGQSASPINFKDEEDSQSIIHILPTHISAFSPTTLSFRSTNPISRLFPHFTSRSGADKEDAEEDEKGHRRRRRSIPQYASPETVFQSSFAACRAGAQRGLNFKCNTKYLPSRPPLSRPKRNIPPITPFPSCPKGQFYGLRRTCVSKEAKIRERMISFGLG